MSNKTPERIDPVAASIDAIGRALERVRSAARRRRKTLDEIRDALDQSRDSILPMVDGHDAGKAPTPIPPSEDQSK